MKIKIILLLLTACLFFTGCTSEKPECAVEIVTNHSQYIEEEGGVVSGTFTETFTVKAGDIFYESSDGKWILNPKNDDRHMGVIAEITAINDNGVTAVIYGEKTVSNALIYGEETVIRYGTGRKISSDMIIYDGPSYEYLMTVSESVE